MFSPRRFAAVARKEFIHVLRDWRSLFLALAIPALLIMLFGYALNLDLKNVPTVYWDQSQSPQSRELLRLFDGSPYFSVENERDNYRDLEADLASGRAMVALVVPHDFARAIEHGDNTAIQAILDGSDANTARLALGYVNALGMIYNAHITAERFQGMGKEPFAAPVTLKPRAWYNASMESRNVLIPGIVAIVMIVIAAMLTSVTIAREWELGTMEQLISTPIRAPELVLGKVVPYFVIGITDVAIAVFLGQALFGVPLRGNPALLFAMASIFLAGALFFGLLLSINLKSQVMANQVALLASYLPTLLLSGFVFAIENMPLPIQCLTYIVPARYFIVLLRGIFLKGIGLEVLWLDAVLLSCYALFMVIVANKRMKLKLE